MATGSFRVNRGGSWGGEECRSAVRGYNAPGDSDGYMGFRVALVPADK